MMELVILVDPILNLFIKSLRLNLYCLDYLLAMKINTKIECQNFLYFIIKFYLVLELFIIYFIK